MASTKAYLDYVLEQLSGLEEISYRAMMGEYILYYRGKVFGGIYDGAVALTCDAPHQKNSLTAVFLMKGKTGLRKARSVL